MPILQGALLIALVLGGLLGVALALRRLLGRQRLYRIIFEAETLQIVLEGTHDSVIAVVVDDMEGQRVDDPEFGRVLDRPRLQEASNLVGKYVVSVPQQVAHDPFRSTEPVPGSGVEIADPGLLCRFDQLCCLAVIEIDEIAAERRAAKTERIDHQTRLSDLPSFHAAFVFPCLVR